MKNINRQSLLAFFLMIIGAVLILGTFIWLQSNSSSEMEEITESSNDIPFPEVKRVSLSDAKAAFDLGTAVFIDVRDEYSYQQGHIPNSILIPINDFQQEINQLDSDQWYILYCT